MMRHIVGGRHAATMAASVLVTVGSVLPLTGVHAATTVQSAVSGCARSVRGGADALQPRELAGACVRAGAAGGARAGVPQAPRTAATTCATVPGVNDRCPQWMAQTIWSQWQFVVASPASDRRFYHVMTAYTPNVSAQQLHINAYRADGTERWSIYYPGPVYHANGNDTPQYGNVVPEAAAVSPDGSVLYVAAAVQNVPPTTTPECGYSSMVMAYRTVIGNMMWLQTYSGSDRNDCAMVWTSMAIDPTGAELFLTGGSNPPPQPVGSTQFAPSPNAQETTALDTRSGEVVWHVTTPNLGDFSQSGASPYRGSTPWPAVLEMPNGRSTITVAYITQLDANLNQHEYVETAAFDSATGAPQWRSRYAVCAACTGSAGISYTSGALSYPSVPALNAVTDGTNVYFNTITLAPQLATAASPNGAVLTGSDVVVAEDAHTGRQTWTANFALSGPSWLAADRETGMLYVYDADHNLTACRTSDGGQAWVVDSVMLATDGNNGPAITVSLDGTHLFMGISGSGAVEAMDARSGSMVWRAMIEGAVDETGGEEIYDASPTVVTAAADHLLVLAGYDFAGSSAGSIDRLGSGYGIFAYDQS